MHVIHTDLTASITELKKNPMGTIKKAQGQPIAILSHNEPVFYCIKADVYEALMEMVEDFDLAKIVKARKADKEIEVDLDDL